MYLINTVDEVAPFQVVFAVAKMRERFLLPVQESLIDTFFFVIRGYHSDNGSEYLNGPVAKLLEKHRIEQTKPRAR